MYKWEWNTCIDTQALQYGKMNIKSMHIMQITRLNTMAHIGTCQSVLGLLMYIHAAWSHVHQCWVTLFTILTKLRDKVISGYMPISPGALHTLPVAFLAPCSNLPVCAGCTNSPACSVCWCAGDDLAPHSGWGPLHVQSITHTLPRQMFGCPHYSVHSGTHWHAAWGSSQSGRCTRLSTPHKGWSMQFLCILWLGLGLGYGIYHHLVEIP